MLKIKDFAVTYYHSPSPDAHEWDISYTIILGAEDAEDAVLSFKEMGLGYVYGVEELQ